MNIDYRKALLAVVAAVIIAVPTASALNHRNQQIEAERQEKSRLQIDIKKRDTELDKIKIQKSQTEDSLKKKSDEAKKLKEKNEQLQKQLQAKREKQAADAKLASTKQSTPVASASVSTDCETYRPLVQKYFGKATDGAMIVMSHESGCNPNAVSSTNDHGLFQLNGIREYNPEANIRIAYQQKFVTPRRGTTPNFSAWYAVCTPNLVPKYSGIWCS